MKARHKWGEIEKHPMTELQECQKCGLIRFKWLRIWVYTRERNENMLVDTVTNEGCNK